jgi:hypothetical protein
VQEIMATMDFTIVGGRAVVGVITPAGEPQPIEPPAAAPPPLGSPPHPKRRSNAMALGVQITGRIRALEMRSKFICATRHVN